MTVWKQSRAVNPAAPDIPAMFQRAFSLHEAERLDEASALYRQIVELAPKNIESLYNLGLIAHSRGELAEAIRSYRRVLEIVPEHVLTLASLGKACRDQGDHECAAWSFQRIIVQEPDHAEALHELGMLAYSRKEYDKAIGYYQKALAAAPDFGLAHYNLGVALYHAGRCEEAVEAYRAAARIHPEDGDIFFNLGVTLKELDQWDEAAASYHTALELNPEDTEAHLNLGIILKESGLLEEATTCFQRCLEIQPGHGKAFCNLGGIHHIQGRIDEAIAFYGQAQEHGEDTPATRHILAALTGRKTESAPQQYVENLFDGYAPQFEQSLRQGLAYRVPEEMARVLAEKLGSPPSFARVLDLGCGTGLAGEVFRDSSHHLVGVDLSSRMLAQARAKEVYDELYQEDLLSFVAREDMEGYDLVLAADVLIYLGRLDPLFAALPRICRPGGRFVFSIEQGPAEEEGYILCQSGRYAHSPSFVRQQGRNHGFTTEYEEKIRIRKDRGQWLQGSLFVLKRQG